MKAQHATNAQFWSVFDICYDLFGFHFAFQKIFY